jgi:hypothetical protein
MSAQRASRISTCLTLVLVAAVLAIAASASASSDKLTVKVGTNKTYTRLQLHPGETVLCRYNGRTLSVTTPTGNVEAVGAGWPKPGTTDRSIFTLNVSVTSGRLFAVACTLGGYHSAPVTIP